ncbi:MAG: ISLre2 family transposase, partial [bacterium]|nr:ISLre2 family transposase [bacterium]
MTQSVDKLMEELKGMVECLDEVILAKAMEWAKQQYKAVAEKLDVLMRRCDKSLKAEHIRSVWYNTAVGRVRVRRRQYRDDKGGYRYLLDELLCAEGKSHTTNRVKHLALGLACEASFRKSARILEETTGIHLSHQTIWNQVARVADPCIERGRREIEWFMETGELPQGEGKKIGSLMLEADGVMLSLQRERARKAEVKVGIAYEGWKRVGRDRFATVGKTIYSEVAGTDEYWAGMTLKLQGKYDLSEVRGIVLGGDGAPWIREGLGHFGGTFQLCRYHLNRELTYALGPDRQGVRMVQGYCERGEIELACYSLTKAREVAKGERAGRIDRVRSYIEANSAGLKDYRLALGEDGRKLRRTGAMEGNVDKLVVRRMKNQGMSWKVKGIRRMLCVRFLHLEGKLKDTINRRDNRNPLP